MKKDNEPVKEQEVLVERKSFNDVTDHFNKIEGNATNPSNAKLHSLPKPIRYIGYFMIFFFALAILIVAIMNIMD
ncbi:amino acid transporter [Rossellomorea sp. GAMAL-10_SWC]